MTQSHRIWNLAEAIVHKAGAEGLTIATAESCTGGRIGAALTDVPGSSAVFERGFITYSNEAKMEMLGVSRALIVRHGAVSGETAKAMAKGALAASSADIAVSVTGIAGPDGGNAEKPVGLVWFGLASRTGLLRAERRVFAHGSRDFVRTKAVETALGFLAAMLNA
ncbi:MAG: CinA family protein [Amphiplicatus sp.]